MKVYIFSAFEQGQNFLRSSQLLGCSVTYVYLSAPGHPWDQQFALGFLIRVISSQVYVCVGLVFFKSVHNSKVGGSYCHCFSSPAPHHSQDQTLVYFINKASRRVWLLSFATYTRYLCCRVTWFCAGVCTLAWFRPAGPAGRHVHLLYSPSLPRLQPPVWDPKLGCQFSVWKTGQVLWLSWGLCLVWWVG